MSLTQLDIGHFFGDPLFQKTFTHKVLDSIQVNSFSRIRTKILSEMPLSLRKLTKNAFKRKRKHQTLFEILALEDCYIHLPEIIQKVKLNLFFS